VLGHQARALHFAVGVLSLPGLVLGHCMAYLLAYPSAEERAHHLQHTGHETIAMLTVAALFLLPVALGFAAMGGLRPGDRSTVHRMALRLAALQCAAFLALELTERGLHLTTTVTDPAVLVGTAIQLPVALGLAHLVAGFVLGLHQLIIRWQIRPMQLSPPKLTWSYRRPGPVCRTAFLLYVHERAPPAALPA
jgi:uncharacterized membrane protein required for colicin V production